MDNSVTNTARLLWAGLRTLLVLTAVTGVLYPLAVTGVAQGFFNDKANGSRIRVDGRVVGSSLIGQAYNLPLEEGQETPEPDLRWFQGRPQNGLGTNSVNTRYELILSGATNRSGDNGAVDGACPKDPAQAEEATLCRWVVAARAAVVKDNSVNGHTVEEVPADAVTSSGSGLDPHISPQYAGIQVHRVAERNGLSVDQVQALVDGHTEGRVLGFVGEPRVNVLELNIALGQLVTRS
ncbi:potassium-transporting ATPase subunit C [Streptomyces beigongshangae]|uniref:potassium-transporting ATPase subunit C n=1 Tax=Streptomyces beigongshangae TaxID=2841597 RepID=UPI001C8535A6|nr:potassium-transporting ATPase subunit C [Streptomyces sp. REN17]